MSRVGTSPRIGAYSATVRDTGFHPLDGARYLALQGWSPRLCGLVAHHSAAHFVAEALGLAADLDDYDREDSAVADALLAADQTVGPCGRRMSIAERLADKLDRHSPGSVPVRVHESRAMFIRAAADRVRIRLHGNAAVVAAADGVSS